MKRVNLTILVIGLAASGVSGLQAQPGVTATMNRIPLEGHAELSKMLSDPKVDITSKRAAIERIGELSKDLLSRKDISPSKLYNPLLGVLTPQKIEGHHVLRGVACKVLGRFSDLAGGATLVGPLAKVVRNSREHQDVRVEAARALGLFKKQPAAVVEALVSALDAEVKRGPQKDNVRITSAVITSLGVMGDKRAFVPLMRVLRSGFPLDTKRNAQAAMEALKWQSK